METYWKYLLIGIGVLILGIIGLILGVPKTIIKNKTARDAALYIGIALTIIGAILLTIGIIMYFRRKSKQKKLSSYYMQQLQLQAPPQAPQQMPYQQMPYQQMPYQQMPYQQQMM